MSIALQTTYNSAPAIGYAGMLEGDYPHDIITMKNVEASASIPFGTAVAFKLSSPGSDLDAVQPATETTIAGIVVHSHAYARVWTASDGTVYGDLDSTGLRPQVLLNVLRKGKILVTSPTAIAVGDRLFVRKDAGEANESLGTLENAADESDMIDCTKQGVWLTSCSAGGLAWLDVDFTAKP